MDRYVLTMLVEPIQADLGINDFQMGLILGPAFGLALGIFGLPLGWLVDRGSRRKIVFFMVSFWSLATMACGLAQTANALFAARTAVGLGEAGVAPATTSILADKFPRERLTTALAIHSSGNKLGSAAAFSLGGLLLGLMGGTVLSVPLLGDLQPWQLVFVLVGLPGVLAAFLVYTFAEPARLGRRSEGPPKAGLLVEFLGKHRGLMLLMYGGFAIIALCGYALVAWVPTFVSRRYGWDPEHYGPALGIVNVIAAGALVLKGILVDWIYAKGAKDAHLRFYSWLLIATTPLAIAVFFSPSPWIFFALYGVLLVVTIPSMMYLSASLALLAPNEVRGQLSALAYMLYSVLGLGLGPTLVGALTNFLFRDEQKIGWSLALVVGLGIPAGAVLLRLAMKPLRAAVAASEALEKSSI
jgi:MFS family permease